jgi:hypothetical protein
MKVLHAGVFDDHELGGDLIFRKGEVETFDYRTLAAREGRTAMEHRFVGLARGKDLVFIGKGDGFTRSSLAEIRRLGVSVSLWYGDIRPEPEAWVLDLLGEVDCYFMSSGGEELARYFERGKPARAAYYFPPVDPDLVRKYSHLRRNTQNIVFTGGAHAMAGTERQEVIRYLRRRKDVKVYGGAEFGSGMLGKGARLIRRLTGTSSYVRGEAYVAAIKSARIGIGVNAVEGVPRYSSDRLSHYLTFGTFFMPKHFPEVDRLFKYKQDLVWFEDLSDLDRKIEYYLREDAERETIAATGQAKALQDLNCTKMVAMMLEVARSGRSDRYPWVEVLG